MRCHAAGILRGTPLSPTRRMPISRQVVRGAVALAALAVVSGCSATSTSGRQHHHSRHSDTTTSDVASSTMPTPSTTAATTTTVPAVTKMGSYAVATTNIGVVEPSPTPGAPSRSLPTTVWYPAMSGTAVPDKGHAPYPLVVFSQGYDRGVSTYAGPIEAWASAGFVVAAPTYPFTDPAAPTGVNENDILNHPADLRVVITTVLNTAGAPTSLLSGLVNPSEIGVVGHSDGADVTLAVTDDSCCADPRVKAAAVLSGAEFAAFGGNYFAGARSVPLLVVQGSADTINAPVCSTQLYDAAPTPKYYLDLLGAGHLPPYVDPGTDQQVIDTVVTDFFDAELAGQGAALAAMGSAGSVPGVTTFIAGASAPPEPGVCPTAP